MLKRWLNSLNSALDEPKEVTPLFSESDNIENSGDGINFRIPNELSKTNSPIKSWLVIGSCLASGFVNYVETMKDGAIGDYILFNNISDLPLKPPRSIDQYDLQLIHLPIRTILPDMAHSRIALNEYQKFQDLYDHCEKSLEILIDSAMKYNKNSGILTIVGNFMVPIQSNLSRTIHKNDLRNIQYFVSELNKSLLKITLKYKNVYILDFDEISQTYGKKLFQDDTLWQYNHGAVLGDNDYQQDKNRINPPLQLSHYYTIDSQKFIETAWQEIKGIFRTVRSIDPIKLVIVDLDDTLWRGVASEKDDPEPGCTEGWPLGLAEALLILKQRGIILAIASKNDESKIREIWNHIWLGRLLLDDFSAIEINWSSKVDNIAKIAASVNILPSNILFIDDNPVERNAVELEFPGIRTLGADLYYIRRVLLWSPELQPALITDESVRRTEMIKSQLNRETFKRTLNRSEFLATLNINYNQFDILSVNDPKFPRTFELINKTNQFNTTGKRWKYEDISSLINSGAKIVAIEVSDKFTNYGLVGAAIMIDNYIEQYVMSCRVIGLDIEYTFLNNMKNIHKEIRSKLTETNRNSVCLSIFEKSNFEFMSDEWIWKS